MCVRECEFVCSVFVGACEHAGVHVCVCMCKRQIIKKTIFGHITSFQRSADNGTFFTASLNSHRA